MEIESPGFRGPFAPAPRGSQRGDPTLDSKAVRIEQKHFYFDLKENANGRYLRITEKSGARSAIVIPIAGLGEFQIIVARFEGARTILPDRSG